MRAWSIRIIAARWTLLRQQALPRRVTIARRLLGEWRTGHVKQALIARMLALRARMPRLFAAGSYDPLVLSGPCAEHVLAFSRTEGATSLLVAVARLAVALLDVGGLPRIDPAAWQGTALQMPPGPWRNVLIPGPHVDGDKLGIAAIFGGLPVACWVAGHG